MKFKLLKESNSARFCFALNSERVKNIATALIVVIMVGGTFFYLFNKDNYQEIFTGNFLGSLFSGLEDVSEKDEEVKEIETYKEVYREKAQEGDGLTNVARRVLKKHFQEKEITDFSPEHKVFMEDYIQKRLGSHLLELGEEVLISQELISQAIQEAELLTDSKLNNLKQYSSLVLSL